MKTEIKHTFKTKMNYKNESFVVEEWSNMVHGYIRHVVKTREKAIRNGLIALGWTPPKEDCEEKI